MEYTKKSLRQKEISILKGIGIALVVLGHVREGNTGPELWRSLRAFIYTFHMPLFFIVSGYLNAGVSVIDWRGYREHLGKVIPRNLVPFFVFTLITATYKLLVQQFIGGAGLKYPVNIHAIGQHFLNPIGGFATYLWFLYALMIIQIIYPLGKYLFRKTALLFIAVTALSYFSFPEIFCLDSAFRNMPFFIFGILAHEAFQLPIIKNLKCLWITVFLISTYLLFFGIFRGLSLSYLVLGIAMTCILWIVSSYLARADITKYLVLFGDKSLDIYLWHTLGIGVIGFALTRMHVQSFWLSVGLCFFFTITLCLVGAEVLNRIPLLRRYMYGRP